MTKKLDDVKYPNNLQVISYAIYCKLYKLLFGVQNGVHLGGYPDYIELGKNVRIGWNVQLISRNHNIYDPNIVEKRKKIVINDNCWIGANSVILPGVKLGKNTIVAAGAVVNNSFPDGYCVIGGVPAKKIKDI
jgi:acetyltransferase-like isoleucine patch superfamily enzyme